MPSLADVGGDEAFTDRMAELFATLADGWHDDDPRHAMRAPAIGHAMRFDTWQSLTEGGLTDDQARDLMVQMVVGVGARSDPRCGRGLIGAVGALNPVPARTT